MLDCYDVFFHIFPVPANPISLCRCHCTCILSCGCVGVSVRRYCCGFWYMSLKIGYRILNCIINFWSLILVSICSLGSPQVLFKVIFCCSYCFICSFLFGIRWCRWLYCIGFFVCLSEWYNRLCENWAGVR